MPFSSQAVALLRDIHPLTGNQQYVFASNQGTSGEKHISRESIGAAIRRMGYQGQHTAHGFRTTASTLLHEQGFHSDKGEKAFTSRLIVSTTDKWSKHAETALENQQIPVNRLRVQDLADSPVDWSQFSLNRPQDIKFKPKKILRPHQKTAQEKVETGFQAANRGKLIMACGTGKTFTALKIAEQLTPDHGTFLFLVPSISLLSQTLREWTCAAPSPFLALLKIPKNQRPVHPSCQPIPPKPRR